MRYQDLNCIEIELAAIRHNISVLKGLLPDTGADILPVIKSDAYGHGMLEVAHVFEGAVWGFAISEMAEAVALREAGITSRILLMSGLSSGSAKEVLDLDLIPGVTDIVSLDDLERVSAEANRYILK